MVAHSLITRQEFVCISRPSCRTFPATISPAYSAQCTVLGLARTLLGVGMHRQEAGRPGSERYPVVDSQVQTPIQPSFPTQGSPAPLQ